MKKLTQVISAVPARDGDGVKIQRLAGRHLQQVMNPFLMIDEINSDDAADYIGGFPEHPHRGFETITYMKAGRMRHRDHMGNEGVISTGDVQWMTAGAGVLHAETPEQAQGLLHGFQLWLNLPAAEKMQAAKYREIKSEDIPEQVLAGGGVVRVIAGSAMIDAEPLVGPSAGLSTKPVFLDVQLNANETVELLVKESNSALVYVYEGSTETLASRQLGVYQNDELLHLQGGPEGVGLLVLSGEVINEPLVQYGPFVMNTSEEIKQAMQDFQNPSYIKQLKSGTVEG